MSMEANFARQPVQRCMINQIPKAKSHTSNESNVNPYLPLDALATSKKLLRDMKFLSIVRKHLVPLVIC